MSIQWLIVVMLIVLFIQSKIYKHFGLKKIEYKRFFSSPAVFKNGKVYMVEVISNNKILPVPWLRLESKINSSLKFHKQDNMEIKHEQFHKSLFTLMPYTRITRKHKIICSKRGCYSLDLASITCGDTFGFQVLTKDIKLSSQLLVYPEIIPLKEISLPSHSWQGDVIVRRWLMEDPFMILGIRNYAPGDTFNKINWKYTARYGNLKVNNLDHTANHKLMIYLNFEVDEQMWDAVTKPKLIEKGITYAASIAVHTLSSGIETGFGCNGCTEDNPNPIKILPKCSKAHLTSLLTVMAKLIIKRSLSFYTFLKNDTDLAVSNTDFLIITPFVSEKIQYIINNLKALGNSVEILKLKQ